MSIAANETGRRNSPMVLVVSLLTNLNQTSIQDKLKKNTRSFPSKLHQQSVSGFLLIVVPDLFKVKVVTRFKVL